jgi:hypothetical protein
LEIKLKIGKYKKIEWKIASILFPILWLGLVIRYMYGDGCIKAGGVLACGEQALFFLLVWFLFCFSWPLYYFFKISPQIRKEESKN